MRPSQGGRGPRRELPAFVPRARARRPRADELLSKSERAQGDPPRAAPPWARPLRLTPPQPRRFARRHRRTRTRRSHPPGRGQPLQKSPRCGARNCDGHWVERGRAWPCRSTNESAHRGPRRRRQIGACVWYSQRAMATRARRWTRWLPVAGLVLVALALSVYGWWPAIDAYPSTQGGDGPQYHKMLEAARVSIRRYHELPLWNPYECGGLPLWDNPQAFVGAPLAWLTFVFGTTKTMEYWFVLHSALGFLAMWVFARDDVRLSRAASFVASSVWAFNGFHQQHYSGGHVTFVPFLYFPFALWLWRRAERDVRFAVGLGLLVAWMMYEGAVYPIPHLAILLAAESLTRAWPPRRLPLLLRAGAIAGLVAFTVAASRFLPVMDQLHTHTRQIGGEHEYLHWHTLKEMFLARTHARYAEEQDYVWPEWGAYLGPILLALAALGVLVEGLEHLWLFALLIFVFLLMGGHFSRFAPWHLL